MTAATTAAALLFLATRIALAHEHQNVDIQHSESPFVAPHTTVLHANVLDGQTTYRLSGVALQHWPMYYLSWTDTSNGRSVARYNGTSG